MTKSIFRFVLIFGVAYVLLYWPATGVNRKYANFFRATGQKLFTEVGDSGLVLFEPDAKVKTKTVLFVTKPSLKTDAGFRGEEYFLNNYLTGFYPTILFLSLVIATPLSWKRKFFALGAGFLIVTAYVMLKLYVFILHAFEQSAWIGLYQDAAVKKSIVFWHEHFTTQPTIDYTFAVIVWMALCMGRKELQRLNVALATPANKNKAHR